MEKYTLDSYVEVLTHTKWIAENMHEAIAGYTKMAQMLEAAVDGLESTASRVQQEVACMHDAVEDYTKMTKMLATAVDGLGSTASHVQREVAYALASFIDEAERTANFYTETSWQHYMGALAQAKKVQSGRKTKLVELLKVKNALRQAKAQLVYDEMKVSI